MSQLIERRIEPEERELKRVLGRGLRAERGVRLSIRTIREAAGRTQIEVAAESQINQGDVSRLEKRESFDDCQVSTLRRYLAALGGELELVAVFGDKRIALAGASTEISDVSDLRRRAA